MGDCVCCRLPLYRSAAIAQERTVFSYRDAENRSGCFFHLLAKDWVELTGSGDRFSFKEVGRQDGSIELFDKSRRGVGVRIFADKSEWKSKEGTQGKWAPLWSGAWTRDADLRPEFKTWGLDPVRQGDRGTCSVFTTNSALEFAFSRYMGKSVHLSVEYLNWAGNQVTGHPRTGNSFTTALPALASSASATPPICLTPRSSTHASHRPGRQWRTPAGSAQWRGKPSETHWINPLKPKPGLTDAQMHEIKAVLAMGWPVAAGAEHSRLLVGYCDDPKRPGGGMFFTKDSATGKYEEATYRFVKASVCDVFWVQALGEPGPIHK